MIRLLPRLDATVLYADVTLLRRMGVLNLLQSSNAVQEPDYQNFVRQTHFDYGKDIDALAASNSNGTLFFVVRGRFDWNRLRSYAESHGGSCKGEFCSAPTSKPNRWASFFPVQSNVLGLAVSSDKTAAYDLSPRKNQVPVQMPSQPVWMSIAPSALKNLTAVPAALQLFAIPLAQAERILFAVGGTPEVWSISLEADCDSPAKAQSLRDRLEDRTSMLKRALLREHEKPSTADLTGLVAEGAFQCSGRKVTGSWPLHKELLNALR